MPGCQDSESDWNQLRCVYVRVCVFACTHACEQWEGVGGGGFLHNVLCCVSHVLRTLSS